MDSESLNDPRAKLAYAALCDRERSVRLFSQPWWLTALAGWDAWGVALWEQDGCTVAALPYVIERRFGLTTLKQPPLSQALGPWMRPKSKRYTQLLGEQKDVYAALIARLPRFDQFVQNFSYEITNWQPFYWNGFQQTTRYTYVLDDLSDEKALWSGLQSNIRGDIRKAETRFKLEVRDDLGIDHFLDLNEKTFARNGMKMPYSRERVRALDAACQQRACRKIWIAVDPEGRHHAGVYIVWDHNSAYYLMGGSDPELRSSGANSLCLWHAIRHASTVTRSFDFEGSMLEPVERYVRAFGAVQRPYFHVWKTPSRSIRLFRALKALR